MALIDYGAFLGPPSPQRLLIFFCRIDKYYMLIRRFVNASFRLLIRTNWEEKTCKLYNDILTSEKGPLWYVPMRTGICPTWTLNSPTDTRVPLGLPNHLSDIYLEELNRASAVTSEQKPLPVPLGPLLDPFILLMAQTPTVAVYKRIHSVLLIPLLEALGTPSRSDDEPSSKRIRRDLDSYSDLIANACFDDPQAGRTDSAELKKRLLKRVFEIASHPETKDASRRKMYALWKERAEEDDLWW